MPNPLIECIPNFSEAQRPEVIDQIVAAIQSVDDVKLLDRSSDLDHNRTVRTFAASPFAVQEATFRAIKTASKLINLNSHTGEYPRIGATDVVPFIPLRDASMDDCIAIAKRLGERVGSELGIPVYLYEAAATRPERVNLENIRKGQYEGLKAEIESNPERLPDYGPAKLGTAGATVIGARNPLIAFNVHLTTDDADIAKKIAKVIRQSSGGLQYVKALGSPVEGHAQISMNLMNFRETPIGRVVDVIRHLAEHYGVGIHHCELVGLIPQDALADVDVWHNAAVDEFSPDQILKARLFQNDSSYPSDFGRADLITYSGDVIKPSVPTKNRKLQVFLCHASKDKTIVRELYQRLFAEGWIDPWLDEKKLLPGQDWDIEIEKAVEVSNVVIVCLSENSVSKDGYIQKELRFALNVALEKPVGTIFLIPVRFDDCFIPRSIRSIQYIDYFPWERKDTAYHLIYESLNMAAQRYQIDTHNWKTNPLIEPKNIFQAVRKYNSSTFVEEVAAATATPGGGSVAAYAGALGAALVEMVTGLTIGKKKYAEVEAEMQVVRDQALIWRLELMSAVDEDSSAFDAVMRTFRLPKGTEEDQTKRNAAIRIVTVDATRVPLRVAKDAVRIMELALKCAKEANINAISDAVSGFAMSRAALTAAGYNVKINLNTLHDKSMGEKMLGELRELEEKAKQLEQEMWEIMESRGGI